MKTTNWLTRVVLSAACLTAVVMTSTVGLCAPKKAAAKPTAEPKPCVKKEAKPCVTAPTTQPAAQEPCTKDGAPAPKVMPAERGAKNNRQPRRMWATSYRWAKAPKLVVEKWLTDKPDTKGKYVLIEFWATWCPPCRRSINLLNKFHKKYRKELVVIGLSEESEADVRKFKKPKVEYFSAIDTKQRMKKEMGVFGIPHVIIVEPGGYVIWEGFPLLKDYELTEEIVEKILEVGRKIKAAKAKAAREAEDAKKKKK